MNKPAFLCVANWDSSVGYAWWLMESFWVEISKHFDQEYMVILAYPSISEIPENIKNSTLKIDEIDFTFEDVFSVLSQIKYIISNKVKYIYLSDRPLTSWRYFFYRLFGVKVIIVHDHTPGIRTQSGVVKSFIKCILSRLPLLNADGGIGATNFVKERLHNINCFPEYKCYSAPNGIPVSSDSNNTTFEDLFSKFDISPDKKIIVSVGRASLYKGIDFALSVLHKIVYSYNIEDVHFLFLGDGPHLDLFKEMAKKLHLSKYVSFPGMVDNVSNILPECHIAFHPSKGEVGYSLAILEYMYAGVPVVVSDNISVCEATEHGVSGLIYKEGDLDDAAENIHYLLKNRPKSQEMGKNARKKIIERYSLKHCHRQLIVSIKSIIGSC